MKMTQDAQETGSDSYAAFRPPSAASYFACPQDLSNWDGKQLLPCNCCSRLLYVNIQMFHVQLSCYLFLRWLQRGYCKKLHVLGHLSGGMNSSAKPWKWAAQGKVNERHSGFSSATSAFLKIYHRAPSVWLLIFELFFIISCLFFFFLP